MFLNTVTQALEKANIPYAIVGGYAVAIHGAVRGTVDIDFVIQWSLASLKKSEHVLKDLGLVSRLPIDAESVFHFRDEFIQQRNLIAWNFYDPKNPMKQVDIIINYDLKNGHTKTVTTPLGKIKVLSLKDLIAMKKASGRPQDFEDVKYLEAL